MLNKLILAAIASLCIMTAQAQDLTIKLWDNATAPHSNHLSGEDKDEGQERISNTNVAELYIYEADPAKATGQVVVICPGGGYRLLAMGHEGHQYAKWMAENGITTAVLKYRLPNGHKEIPLEDTTEALRTMRRRSKELGFDPTKLGMMGSSAGGHLTAYTSNFAPFADRPAFAVLFYPVITGEEGLCHKGSFDHLLGADATAYERAEYSLETRVTKNTPPTLILTSDNDTLVPTISSTRYYNALRKHGVQASLHIYPGGYHGFCMHDDVAFKLLWQQAMIEWIRSF